MQRHCFSGLSAGNGGIYKSESDTSSVNATSQQTIENNTCSLSPYSSKCSVLHCDAVCISDQGTRIFRIPDNKGSMQALDEWDAT